MEPLYTTTIHCICCETSYSTSKVRPSFKKASVVDSDFCGHYSNGVNPDYYVVRVCPSCGFASTENGMVRLNDAQKKAYYERIGTNWRKRDFGGERTALQAMTTYKLALLTAQAVNEKDRILAGILHHIAWLYRLERQEKEEQRFLSYALEAYIRVFETEGSELNKARLMFLIGELHRRTGSYKEAVKWFSRVVNDKRIMDAAMIRASREQWQLMREELEDSDRDLGDSAAQPASSA
ncbi:DUF2225 domain-containing protein [Paenibacillus sp. HB172176]|uniref:DUF2225 domain-containing protein n=1 Tax=Paenibacillus sp. HB172176 TaxID=2493690 RepID=UPI00143BE644|nr:DUF2225 domain-containing protein [Paenibacillus sp. HB172176]